MNISEYLENEFNYLEKSEKNEYLKKCFKDVLDMLKLDGMEFFEAELNVNYVFNCIHKTIENNKANSLENLIEISSKILGNLVEDPNDEEQLELNKKIIETLSVIYNITKEDEFKKFNIDINEFIDNLYRLSCFKPLTPVEGKEDEWVPDDPENISFYYNKRYTPIQAKDKNGTDAINVCASLFSRDDGSSWTYNSEHITFPFKVPLYTKKEKLENFVKDIYGPSVFVKINKGKENKGTPKYQEFCLAFLPSTSEGQYTDNNFTAVFGVITRVYSVEEDKIKQLDIAELSEKTTREEASKAFFDLDDENSTIRYYIDKEDIVENVDLKELW